MNDHMQALLYLLMCYVLIVLFYVEKLAGQGLFSRALTFIVAVFFFAAAACDIFLM